MRAQFRAKLGVIILALLVAVPAQAGEPRLFSVPLTPPEFGTDEAMNSTFTLGTWERSIRQPGGMLISLTIPVHQSVTTVDGNAVPTYHSNAKVRVVVTKLSTSGGLPWMGVIYDKTFQEELWIEGAFDHRREITTEAPFTVTIPFTGLTSASYYVTVHGEVEGNAQFRHPGTMTIQVVPDAP